MKQFIALCSMLFIATAVTGCGGAGPEVDPDANAEAKKLEESPDYEKEMMGEMGGGSGK